MGINVQPSGFVRLPTVPRPQLLGRGVLTVGPDVPPASEVGDLWWRTTPDGALYLYYDDGSSAQWVAATPAAGVVALPEPRWIEFPNTPLTVGQNVTATNGITYTWDGKVWVANPPAPPPVPAPVPRPIAQYVFSAGVSFTPGTAWQDIAQLPAITTRGGPIILVVALSAYLQFTAQPTGTAAWAQVGWALSAAAPSAPDVWIQQYQFTVVSGTGGTVVQVPIGNAVTFDQRSPNPTPLTYHLFLSTSSAGVTFTVTGGRIYGYELLIP
jgi:hypothetical protein